MRKNNNRSAELDGRGAILEKTRPSCQWGARARSVFVLVSSGGRRRFVWRGGDRTLRDCRGTARGSCVLPDAPAGDVEHATTILTDILF